MTKQQLLKELKRVKATDEKKLKALTALQYLKGFNAAMQMYIFKNEKKIGVGKINWEDFLGGTIKVSGRSNKGKNRVAQYGGEWIIKQIQKDKVLLESKDKTCLRLLDKQNDRDFEITG